MTKILYFALKIKGGGREGGTCEVLRPCHPLRIRNVHQLDRAIDMYHFCLSNYHASDFYWLSGQMALQTFDLALFLVSKIVS